MRTAIAELVRTAAKTLLAHQDAGRYCDPESLRWARQMLKQNMGVPPKGLNAAQQPQEVENGARSM